MKRITLVWLTIALFACANACSATLEYRIVDLSESGPEMHFYEHVTAVNEDGDICLRGYRLDNHAIINVIRSGGIDQVITPPSGYVDIRITQLQSKQFYAGFAVDQFGYSVPFVVQNSEWRFWTEYKAKSVSIIGLSGQGDVMFSNGVLWKNGVVHNYTSLFPEIKLVVGYHNGYFCGLTQANQPFIYTDHLQRINIQNAVGWDIDELGNSTVISWAEGISGEYGEVFTYGANGLQQIPRAWWFEEGLLSPTWLNDGGLLVTARIYREEYSAGVYLDGHWMRLPGLEGGAWVPDAGPEVRPQAGDRFGNIYGHYWSYQTWDRAVMWYLTPEPSPLLALGMMVFALVGCRAKTRTSPDAN